MKRKFKCTSCDTVTLCNELSSKSYQFPIREKFIDIGLDYCYISIEQYICGECRQSIFEFYLKNNLNKVTKTFPELTTETIKPEDAKIKQFPECVPLIIRQDYEEASKIKDISPKAAATLARRALQGMIRDYWNIQEKTLAREINNLKELLDEDTFKTIDAVREIGNIGAHMEIDVNVIIEINPSEAEMLISLLEDLIEDWYIAREQRRVRNEKLQQKADEIKQLKQTNGQNSTVS